MKIITTSFLFLILLNNISFAAEKYVDCTLNTGTNDGSSWANAYRSFADMGSNPANGDTIYVSGGTTSKTCAGGIDLVKSWTIKPGAASSNPSGHDGTVVWSNGGIFINGYRVYDVVIDGLVNNAKKFDFGTNHIAGEPKTVIIRGITFTKPSTYAIYLTNPIGEIDSVYINGLADADGDVGIKVFWNSSGPAKNWGLFTIKNSTIRVPYHSGGGLGADAMRVDTGVDIYNNTVIGYQDDNYTNTQHQDGVQVNNPDGYLRIYNNTFTGLVNYGLFMEDVTKDLYIYNNVFYKQRDAIVLGKGSTFYSNIRVENNTLVDGHGGYGIKFDPYSPSTMSNVYIRNNIFANMGTAPSTGGAAYFVNIQCSDSDTSKVIFDYNIHAAGNSGVNAIYGCGAQTHDGGTAVPSFASYTPDAGAVNNYHLSSTDTRAKDRGVAGFFPSDKDGIFRPQGSAWDIGAYESSGTAAPTGGKYPLYPIPSIK